MNFYLCKSESPILIRDSGLNVTFLVEVASSKDYNETEVSQEEVTFQTELKHLSGGGVEGVGANAELEWLICETFSSDQSSNLGLRIRSGPVTQALREVFGDGVMILVKINGLRFRCNPEEGYDGSTKMKILSGAYFACEEAEWLTPRQSWRAYGHPPPISGSVTVEVCVEELHSVALGGPNVIDKMHVLKKMLEEGIQSDLVVIPDKGVEVKAHKAVLAAQSAVFRAMFESDMQEARTHQLKMPDMTEAGVRALLAYLYCWEETEPNAKPLVAQELLYAGHKYDIPVLERAMKKLLLGKPNEWFSVNDAIKIYLFAKNIPPEDGECLKRKAIRVLKRNSATLTESPTYTTLFKEDPKTAMELCAYGFVDKY